MGIIVSWSSSFSDLMWPVVKSLWSVYRRSWVMSPSVLYGASVGVLSWSVCLWQLEERFSCFLKLCHEVIIQRENFWSGRLQAPAKKPLPAALKLSQICAVSVSPWRKYHIIMVSSIATVRHKVQFSSGNLILLLEVLLLNYCFMWVLVSVFFNQSCWFYAMTRPWRSHFPACGLCSE